MKDFKKIDNLVIRAYGVQGNIDKSTSSYVMGNYMNVSMLPGVTEDLISLGNPPNKRLRWEKTKTMNFGTDIALFNNALNVTVDYYRRKGTDFIALHEQVLLRCQGFYRQWLIGQVCVMKVLR